MNRDALHDILTIAPEVRDALANGIPVVALETTIVTHGMPYPQNVATARDVEAIVRDGGGVPATIAIFEGRIRVGLTLEEIERLAQMRDVRKLSRADLPFAIATEVAGATTVAATMICAHLAGIDVFATGGIGGVHRGAENTFDISADLGELARTPVVVVCAGPKALLDVPKTLEVLETLGVATIAYGVDDFPAFWSRSSGLTAPLRADSPAQIARIVRTQRALDYVSGTLVANPVDASAEIPTAEMSGYIDTAVADARASGINGKAVTPYLLDRILTLTGGRSLTTNIALVRGNVALAIEVARELLRPA